MKRGFGSPKFDKTLQRAIAAHGGRRAHQLGVAHTWTRKTAKLAGRQGGLASAAAKQARKAATHAA